MNAHRLTYLHFDLLEMFAAFVERLEVFDDASDL